MARDKVAATALKVGAAVAEPAGTAINTANKAELTACQDTSKIVVRVENSTAAAKKVTIKAGSTNPPAVRRGLGDLVIEIAEKSTVDIVVESARHLNPDGTIYVDYEAGMTGHLSALQIPKAV